MVGSSWNSVTYLTKKMIRLQLTDDGLVMSADVSCVRQACQVYQTHNDADIVFMTARGTQDKGVVAY